VQEWHEGIVLYPIRGNLRQCKTYDIELIFIKACSDLCVIHQRKCKNGKKKFSIHLVSDEITMRGYMVLTFTKCITIMIAELTVTSGL
jgi:hypothetical protein